MNPDFISALKQIEKEREIPLEVILVAIEDALTAAYKRNYTSSQDVIVKIDRATGTINATAAKLVVENVSNSLLEISLSAAQKINPKMKLGSEIEVVVTPDDFGRIAAQTAKQVIVQRIREAERDIVFDEFTKREEELVSGIVQRYEQKNYMVDLGRVEGVLPLAEHVISEHFKHGDRIKAVILRAQKTPKGPQIILSRTTPSLVSRLFENEVPEIASGVIQIRSIVREPGNRSKIAVESKDPKIDPVGACVGPKGSRVQSIVDELKNEKIDIINWNQDPSVYIANSLSPAKVLTVKLYAYDKSALVVVPDHQLSLAIGKEGQNVRLAARLTGWKIDIKSESQYEENREEIEAKALEMALFHAEENERLRAEEEKKRQELFERELAAKAAQMEQELSEESESQDEPEDSFEQDEPQDLSFVEQPEPDAQDSAAEEAGEDYRPETPEPAKFMPVDAPVDDPDRPRKKKRKERRVEEEREEIASRKKKKAKRSRSTTEDFDDDSYDSFGWES